MRGERPRIRSRFWLLIVLIVLSGLTGAVVRDQWGLIRAQVFGQRSPLADAWEGIDLLAAHPEDPALPAGVSGALDTEVASLDEETVQILLSYDAVEAAMLSDSPRHLFALGRVAMFHDLHETAYDLLATAAESGSAPAHMYLADYFVDDPAYAATLIQMSVKLGFTPAKAALAEVEQILASGETNPLRPPISSPSGGIDFSRFNQGSLLLAFYEGRGRAVVSACRVPPSAPDFMLEAQGDPLVHEIVTTMYAAHLIIALNDRARQENPGYLPDLPKLTHLVDGSANGVAVNKLDTDNMLVYRKGVHWVRRLQVVPEAIGKLDELSGQPLSLDSVVAAGENIYEGWRDYDKRTKSTDRLDEAIKAEAELDANLLQEYYYYGQTEAVRVLYGHVRDFIMDE